MSKEYVMVEKYGTVEMKDWRKDHWSMLAYIECRCVDYKGVLESKYMRCNELRHPEMSLKDIDELRRRLLNYVSIKWHDKYSTRISRGRTIRGHDDWDCAEDLQAAGLIEIVSMADFQLKMTELGWAASALLRKHKSGGGVFADFRFNLAQ